MKAVVYHGKTHVPRYVKKLMAHIETGDIDPSFVISHTLPLANAPKAYEMFHEKEDNCLKVVLKPHGL